MTEGAAQRHLLVTSTGGHLEQLRRWSTMIGSAPDSLWVTSRSPQSESALINHRVLYVPYVAPRDGRAIVHAFATMMKRIDWKAEGFTAAITTGAALGLAGLAAARLHGVPASFIESMAFVDGPSLSARIASFDPGIELFCQYEHRATGRWQYRGSLFDTFATVAKPPSTRPRLFVTLGTIQPYRFEALVQAVLASGLADDQTVWQLGATLRPGLPGTAVAQFGADDFEKCARAADVVITHAGAGNIMSLLEMGICPVVVPRRAKRNEHVNDHQVQIAGLLERLGISTVDEVEHLTGDTIIAASARAIAPRKPQP